MYVYSPSCWIRLGLIWIGTNSINKNLDLTVTWLESGRPGCFKTEAADENKTKQMLWSFYCPCAAEDLLLQLFLLLLMCEQRTSWEPNEWTMPLKSTGSECKNPDASQKTHRYTADTNIIQPGCLHLCSFTVSFFLEMEVSKRREERKEGSNVGKEGYILHTERCKPLHQKTALTHLSGWKQTVVCYP